MKKQTFIFLVTIVLAGSMGMFTINAHADTTRNTKVTTTVTEGEFSITASDAMLFNDITYTGTDLSTISSSNATVTTSDKRGTFSGWAVTIKQIQETDQNWGTGMVLTLKDTSNSSDKGIAVSETNSLAFSQTKQTSNYTVEQSRTYSGNLKIPASVKVGKYATTLVWTLGATPSA